MFSQTAQVSKAVNSRAVPVCPAGLQGVSAHQIETDELKAFVRVGHVRPQNITENIRFAAASCAWTRASEHFEFQERFFSVVPGNRQFVSDLLDINGLQTHYTDGSKSRVERDRSLLAAAGAR
jgi:hypothetical protein